MAVREDWTRITQNIHDLFLAFRSSAAGAFGRNSGSRLNSPRVRPAVILFRNTIDPRFLGEIERRRNQAYLSSLRNQMR